MIVRLKENFNIDKDNDGLEDKHAVHSKGSWDSFVFINSRALITDKIDIELVTGWFVKSCESYEQKNTPLNNCNYILVPKNEWIKTLVGKSDFVKTAIA